MLSDYDRTNVEAILHEGLGDWYGARLLRALDSLLPHADTANRFKLEVMFPDECALLVSHYNRRSEDATDNA